MQTIFDRKIFATRLRNKINKMDKCDFIYKCADQAVLGIMESISKNFNKGFLYHAYSKLMQKDLRTQNLNKVFIGSQIDEYIANKYTQNVYDLIVSSMSIHFINNIPKLLHQYYKYLAKNGLFISVFLGENTLGQLRYALSEIDLELFGGTMPRVAPMIDVKTMGMLLQKSGFNMPVTWVENIAVSYTNFSKIISDIRIMGLSNCMVAKSNKYLTKSYYNLLENKYCKDHSHDSKIKCSYDLIVAMASK